MVGNTGLHVQALAEYFRKTAGKLYKDDFAKASISIIILRYLPTATIPAFYQLLTVSSYLPTYLTKLWHSSSY